MSLAQGDLLEDWRLPTATPRQCERGTIPAAWDREGRAHYGLTDGSSEGR